MRTVLGVVGVTLLGLVMQSRVGVVRARRLAVAHRVPHDLDGLVRTPTGHGPDTDPIHLWALGDSAMAGDGIADPERTLPRQIARQLAARTGRDVVVVVLGLTGAKISEVTDLQVPRLAGQSVDVVVVSAGVNDGLGRRRGAVVRRDQRALAAALAKVVPTAALAHVGAPDLRHAPSLPLPLRWLVGWLSGRVGRRQDAWLADTDVVVVPMGTPRVGFAPDGFHPGPLATPLIAGWVVDALMVAHPDLSAAPPSP